MTTEQIKVELQNKIKEYEMQSKLVSQEVINRLNDLIKEMEEKKVVEKEIKVEVKEEEKPIRSRGKSKWK